jgi:hypothetical protein
MNKDGENPNVVSVNDDPTTDRKPKGPNRRQFLGGVSGVAAAAATFGAIGLEPLVGGKDSVANASVVCYPVDERADASLRYRIETAKAEDVNVPEQPDNGDSKRFTDFSGNYSKALAHDALGVPNLASYQSLIFALTNREFSDFQNIIVGTPVGGGPNSKLVSPPAALAFDLEGLDSHATVIPPAPSVASAQTAAEEVEHYWAALLRDVSFNDYPGSALVANAVADMNNLSFLKNNKNIEYPYPVTPENLFRGQIFNGDGNVLGPYISQFMVQPTFLGVQPLSQQYKTFNPGISNDFMTHPSVFQLIQDGGASGSLSFDKTFRYVRNGRDLAAYTHVDALYQAYLTAYLVLSTISAPPNPGNPYIGSKTQKSGITFGTSDAPATIAEMATRALKGACFHKWIVDLRLRPEEYGGLVQARLTGTAPSPQAAAALHGDVLNSAVLPIIKTKYGSYLLPQAFPEGAPTFPCYPAGHGAVAGACITAIKFFFDGTQKIRPLLTAAAVGRDVVVPSDDGLSLNTYAGSDSDSLDINGELSKLAFNISLGHGIHAGIHFRSSTFWSLLLGEQIALSILNDRAKSYAEPFTITITKFDGTLAKISNERSW